MAGVTIMPDTGKLLRRLWNGRRVLRSPVGNQRDDYA